MVPKGYTFMQILRLICQQVNAYTSRILVFSKKSEKQHALGVLAPSLSQIINQRHFIKQINKHEVAPSCTICLNYSCHAREKSLDLAGSVTASLVYLNWP